MKVKNLVFSGAMASILMMGAAVADVTFSGKIKDATTGDLTAFGDVVKTYKDPNGGSVSYDPEAEEQPKYVKNIEGTNPLTPGSESGAYEYGALELTTSMGGIDQSGFKYVYVEDPGEETEQRHIYSLKAHWVEDGENSGWVAEANGEYKKTATLTEISDIALNELVYINGKTGNAALEQEFTVTNGKTDFNANMYQVKKDGDTFTLIANDSGSYSYRKNSDTETHYVNDLVEEDVVRVALENAIAYYEHALTDDGITGAIELTQGYVDDELDSAADLLTKYGEISGTLETLKENEQSFKNAKSNYENAESADKIYNSNILGTIDGRINTALTSESSELHIAIRDGIDEAKAYTDTKVAELRNDIDALDSKVNDLDENLSAGIASSVALSAVEVSNVKKGEMSVGGGYGNYNSKSAMAFGAALGLTDNWSANAGVGLGFGKDTKASFRIGTNYKFKLF